MPGGPFSAFHPISAPILRRYLTGAQTLARTFYDRDHSNDPTGAAGEDIPQWARLFFRLFENMSNNPRSVAARAEIRQIVSTIAGRQAPLGHSGAGVAQLRTETSQNVGTAAERRRVVGDVAAEEVPVANDQDLIEGRDDVSNVRPASRGRAGTGTRRRNATFAADRNDPSERFNHMREGWAAMNTLAESISIAMRASVAAPLRTHAMVVRDYVEVRDRRNDAANTNEDTLFFDRALSRIRNEFDSGVEQEASNASEE